MEKIIKKIFLGILFCLFVYLAFQTLQRRVFSIHFVDEDENIIAGYYMAKGEKLYSDIFSHKQPMPAVFSVLINKICQPNSLFLLIKRHREAVFFYSVFWWLIFLLQFGSAGLIFSMVIEISKRFLLGDLFLGESLVIYPLVYVLGCLWQMEWSSHKLNRGQQFLFFLSLVLIPFQLFALIPFAAIVFLYLFLKKKQKKKIFFLTLLIFLFFVLIFAPFVNYQDYFFNTKAAISTHYLRDLVGKGFGKQFFLSFLRPLAIFVSLPKGDFGRFVWFLSAFYVLSFGHLLLRKKKKKFLLFTFVLLGMTSLRPEQIEATFYGGFHIFPWFACLVYLTVLQIKDLLIKRHAEFISASNLILKQVQNDSKYPALKIKTSVSGVTKFISLLVVFFLVLFSLNSCRFLIKDYFRPTDREKEFWINFSRFLGLGRVIKTLSIEGDKLMVIPVEQLLYFTSGLDHQNRFLYTYEWIFLNKALRKELEQDLKRGLPAFVYYDYQSVGEEAKSLLDPLLTDYVQLRQNKATSNLLVRGDKLENLEDWQVQELKNFGFTIPN